jgi:hypothetical protein
MIIRLGDNVVVIQESDGEPCIVTRSCIMGGVATHIIHSPYDAHEIAAWLSQRLKRGAPLAQHAFPDMKSEDREFLISGITPEYWNKMFPKEEKAHD